MFKTPKSTSSRLTQIAQERSGQPGQVAVVVLLIMAALLIIVLNYASRTTDQVFLSGQQQDSTRVFNAAESGIEETLSKFEGDEAPDDPSLTGPDGISFSGGQAQIDAQNGELTIANLSQGMTATVYVDGDDDASIDWAGEGTCDNRAALILTLYYQDSVGNTKTKYRPVRPTCSATASTKALGFENAVASTSSEYENKVDWAFGLAAGETAKVLRITALYSNTKLRVTDVAGIQAHDVTVRASDTADATGSTGGTASEERAIQVTRTVPAPPMVLDYAVYSGASLAK